ncbi:nucleoside triphosphate pyrophosphohydrolase [soil metagenome]
MYDLEKLHEIMGRLRDPQRGCPWDLEQDFRSIAPYTIEEAFEVADAIARNDLEALRDELGDLLFQVVFHSRIAAERGAFAFSDVVDAICAKMVRRHPHVFEGESIGSAAEQSEAWERHKVSEREPGAGVLDDVPVGLPALIRAMKLGGRAARVGFDWPDSAGVRRKLTEELNELDAAVESGGSEAIEAEVGDLLFAAVNFSRHLGVDPESALRQSNMRFERRFSYIEQQLSLGGRDIRQVSLDELEALWNEAKAREEPGKPDAVRS